MAKSDGATIKQPLLLGFVAISLILIGLIWADGMTQSEPATPGFYRETFQVDESIYATITAEAIEYREQLGGTPAPNREEDHASGQGQGRGQGRGDDH